MARKHRLTEQLTDLAVLAPYVAARRSARLARTRPDRAAAGLARMGAEKAFAFHEAGVQAAFALAALPWQMMQPWFDSMSTAAQANASLGGWWLEAAAKSVAPVHRRVKRNARLRKR